MRKNPLNVRSKNLQEQNKLVNEASLRSNQVQESQIKSTNKSL